MTKNISLLLALALSACTDPSGSNVPAIQVGDTVMRNAATTGVDCGAVGAAPATYTVQATLSSGFTSIRESTSTGSPFLVDTRCLLLAS